LAKGSGEKLKLLTKLILLYLKKPAFVEAVFFRHWWRRLRTVASYVADKPLPKDAVNRILAESKGLVSAVKAELGSRDLRFFGDSALEGGPAVFILHREYKPSPKPDFRDHFKTLFSYGAIVFGLNLQTGSLEIKRTGLRIADAIRSWVQTKLGVQFRLRHGTPFMKYDAEKCQQSLLGGYDEGHGLKIVAARYHWTTAPGHPPLTLEAAYAGPSLKDSLAHLHSRELLRLRTFADIDWIRFRYESTTPAVRFECTVEVTPLLGGAVEFSVDDTGMREADRETFSEAFQKTFGLPIGQAIAPKAVGTGKAGIYRALLDTDLRRDVQSYQEDCLKELLKLGIIKEEEVGVRQCRTGVCSAKGVPVPDRSIEKCPRCHQKLKFVRVQTLVHDEQRMVAVGGETLAKATGWSFSKQPTKFDRMNFYPLRNPQRPEETVCVFFDKRVSKQKIEVFDRAAFPLLVVHTSGDYEHAYLDMAGIAHLGFAYALAATSDVAAQRQFKQDCEKALQDLRERMQLRVQRAAHQSRATVRSKPAGYRGEEYEADVFNLLHGVFPYTMRWGGKNIPDGFCSLLFFEDNDLARVTKFNWSYDTKYSDSPDGYDFGMAEKRQMFDYVSAPMKQKRLQTQGDRLDAHVIISNNLDPGKMKDAARVLRHEHRLGKNHPDLKLVLMEEDFVTTLHDRVQSESQAFRRRWPYLSERLAYLMKREGDDGYVHLRRTEAESLVGWVLQQKQIEEPVEQRSLRDSLKETVTE
jgi:hypothetical protein